tara:strand:- start:191 stop:502 length:312 start_codon:yes stop_codon:yes gene_type:complete
MNTDQFDGHTPGPWLFGRNLNVYDRRGNIVVHVDDLLEGEHDARLIAAAPDLLAEVKRLRKELDVYYQWENDLRAFTNSNGFDEMKHYLHGLMIDAGLREESE